MGIRRLITIGAAIILFSCSQDKKPVFEVIEVEEMRIDTCYKYKVMTESGIITTRKRRGKFSKGDIIK